VVIFCFCLIDYNW